MSLATELSKDFIESDADLKLEEHSIIFIEDLFKDLKRGRLMEMAYKGDLEAKKELDELRAKERQEAITNIRNYFKKHPLK